MRHVANRACESGRTRKDLDSLRRLHSDRGLTGQVNQACDRFLARRGITTGVGFRDTIAFSVNRSRNCQKRRRDRP
jgi:hypothetical protein